jgi:hypothetical protein
VTFDNAWPRYSAHRGADAVFYVAEMECTVLCFTAASAARCRLVLLYFFWDMLSSCSRASRVPARGECVLGYAGAWFLARLPSFLLAVVRMNS